jgi:protein gp37
MAQLSQIEWTDTTWNPVTGCTKVSPGCKFCYAERMARRLHAMGQHRYRNRFRTTLQLDLVEAPLSWSTPRIVFVNSMSDLFHADVPSHFIEAVFDTIKRADQHVFQVLTKRSERVREMARDLPWPENLWMGVSVESQDYLYRVRDLQHVPAKTRFLSVEPLLGPLRRLPLSRIGWVIVGGESGPGARTMDPNWARAIRDRCKDRGVPFFFKQWGGVRKKETGRTLDGRTWDELPDLPQAYLAARDAQSNPPD